MCEFCSNQYHLSNAKWGEGEYGTPGGTVTWAFATTPGTGFGFSSYITEPAYRALIRDAFQAWEDAVDIDFVELAPGADADVMLGFDQIDGAYGVVGEAASRGSRTTETLFSMTEAEIRFDVDENWATDQSPARNEIGLYQVALHEIGHIMGLNHTTDPNTIMYSSDISGLEGLTAGDIEGARLFYGAAATPPQPQPQPVEPPDPPAPGMPNPVQAPVVADGMTGTNGNDTFTARAGDELINGRGGTDTLNLNGNQTHYTLELSPDGITLTDRTGRDGSDALQSIERLDFDSGASSSGDFVFNVDAFDGIAQLSAEELAQVVELYIAYFNRAPDAGGLAFWGNAYADGLSLEAMAALFIDQDETRAAYPDTMSDVDFALAVYQNVLGRVPDADGFAFWVDVLSRGDVGRDTFILAVLEGAKADIAPDASPGFAAQVMADRDYLANKADIGAYFAVHHGMSNVEEASQVMAVFDGSQASLQAAFAAVDDFFQDALDTEDGDFLMPLVGVLDMTMH